MLRCGDLTDILSEKDRIRFQPLGGNSRRYAKVFATYAVLALLKSEGYSYCPEH
jgi:hypothetical protein